MKKLLSIFLILSLLLSFAACGDNDEHKDDKESDSAETKNEDTVDYDNVVYADKDEILNLAKSAESYAGIFCVAQTQIFSVYTQEVLLSEMSSYTRDSEGNIISTVIDENGNTLSAEYLIGGEYYTGEVTEGEGVKITLTDDEAASVSEVLKNKGADRFSFSFDDFSKIEAVDNEDGTYTLICNSSDEKITSQLTNEAKNEIEAAYPGYESYSVTSVDYQYTIDADGKLKGFVIMASIEVIMPEEETSEDETTAAVTFSNYVSFVYAVAVNEYTDSITSESIDLSGVTVTESTYSELFGE